MKTYEKGISLSIWTLSWPTFIYRSIPAIARR